MDAVNDMVFHPNTGHLISCSNDETIRFYNVTAGSAINKPVKKIQESHRVRTIDVHPSGQFLAAGTSHAVLRLYDVNTAQCTALSGSISTVLTGLSWICVGIQSRRALPSPVCA